MNRHNLFLVLLITLLFSCKGRQDESIKFEKIHPYLGNEHTYLITLESNDEIIIGLTEKGKIKHLSTFLDSLEQVISFFENGGIQSKLKIDENYKIQDRAYYFYKNSGNLESSFNYVDGIKVGSAVAYHDSSDHIKEVMIYTDEGKLYSRKTYDWDGKLVKTEGGQSYDSRSTNN